MILMQSHSKYLLQILTNRLQNIENGVELDCHWIEFDDVRYHIQASVKSPHALVLSVSLPTPPPETVFASGLPVGAIEAVKSAYGQLVHILDPPRDGFNLTMKLNLSKLPPNEGPGKHTNESWIRWTGDYELRTLTEVQVRKRERERRDWQLNPSATMISWRQLRNTLLMKIASVREIVLGAPLRVILKHLASRTVSPDRGRLVSVVHRPTESYFLFPQADKVTVVFPMRFSDSIDTVLATSFLQEFVEARRTAGLSNAPPCSWSSSPPTEVNDAPAEALTANAGYISFVILPRHVDSRKLDKTVWNLSTFHAFVKYHVKCSEGFMHTRMRRRVESLIEALDRAKPDVEKEKKTGQNTSFKRMSLKEARSGKKY